MDDGTGPVRVIVGPAALGGLDPGRGDAVTATGPLGQRDSGGTGLAGYRLYATLPGELVIEPPARVTLAHRARPPPREPGAQLVARPDRESDTQPLRRHPTASPSAGTSPTPTTPPSTTPLTVAEGRQVAVGGAATVRGVVIAEAGRLGTPRLLAIGDASAASRFASPTARSPPDAARWWSCAGSIAAPYGQTELRLVAGGLSIIGHGDLPRARRTRAPAP